VKVSPQGVMSSKKVNDSPGLSPIDGQIFSLGTQTRSRDEFASLSSGTVRALPSCPVLVN
jgi:hypothetical protein